MIYGIGTDIFHSERINKLILNYNEKFINRLFGKNEIKLSQKKKNKSLFFSKRFSAKVSFCKAFSSKNDESIYYKDIEILSDHLGKPIIKLNGKTKLQAIEKENKINRKFKFYISLSDEPPNVLSFVIIFLAPL